MAFYLYAGISCAFAVEDPISKVRLFVEENNNDELSICITLSQFKSWLGDQLEQENRYNLVHNNCQHFAHDLLTVLGVGASSRSSFSGTSLLQYHEHSICGYTIELPGLELVKLGNSSVRASFIEGVKSLFKGWCTCGDLGVDVDVVVSSVFVRVLIVSPKGFQAPF